MGSVKVQINVRDILAHSTVENRKIPPSFGKAAAKLCQARLGLLTFVDDRRTMIPMTPRVLIIDDDRELADMLERYLSDEGFSVNSTHDAEQGRATVANSLPDVVVLDVMLPGANGFDLLRSLRHNHPRLPVIMLTARGEAVDRILGLELGADDYLAKPFDPRELAARLRAVLRRAQTTPAAEAADSLQLASLCLDGKRKRATLGETPIELTAAEFRVLAQLGRMAGTPVERSELTEQSLGRKLMPYDRSIDTHVSNLRRKLLQAGAVDVEIRAVRGTGYELIVTGER